MASDASAAARVIYDLADSLIRFRHYAERNWCGAELDDPLPEIVDTLVGRIQELTDDLGDHVADDGLAARRKALCQAVDRSWAEFKQAWLGKQHRELIGEIRDADFRCDAERHMIAKSPLGGATWKKLKHAAERLRDTLPAELYRTRALLRQLPACTFSLP